MRNKVKFNIEVYVLLQESVFVLGNSVGHMTCVRLGRVRGKIQR